MLKTLDKTDAELQISELSDEHYLRAVTKLGDSRKVVSDRDIYSQSGIKLVATGVRITSDLYERLVKHKLLLSLDNALSVENMLDSKCLMEDVDDLFRTNEKLKRMLKVVDKSFLEQQVLAIQFPPPLAFKLTVAREQYPKIYKHSLLLMVIGVYLASCDRMDASEQKWIATAALFQDIGLLYIDPELLVPSHVMSNAEKRHLYAHPLTAYLLLCEFPVLPKQIADAVLEHHERMDGSGYPRSLHGDKISRYGQILAVAELAAKALGPDLPKVPWKKLEMMLKLNSRQFGQGLIGHLDVFRDINAAEEQSSTNDPAHLAAQVALIAELFDDFNHHFDSKHHDKIFDLAQTRLQTLKLKLFEAGFDPLDPSGLIQRFIDDPEFLSEYAFLLNEAVWQFRSLVLEISRHWPEEAEEDERQSKIPEHAWLYNMKHSLLIADLHK
jgi:HD-GYP domain-containing protein (c-di-GMP phosphodiesterase class II)